MFSGPSQPDEAGEWVKILDQTEDYRFGKLFRIIRARLQYRRFDSRMSNPVTRINFERGDSVGVLLYDPQDDAVILVRQFRYPVYARLDPNEREGDGARRAWLLEIVAGVIDEGRAVKEVANKELLEEAGYRVKGELQPITTIYPSPGGTSERIHLFLGEVDHRQRADKGGGVAAEGEDTQIVVLPFHEAMDMVARGELRDAKTIIALQHLALRKAGKVDTSNSTRLEVHYEHE
jgi:ADP-ribose pyrophosphatase